MVYKSKNKKIQMNGISPKNPTNSKSDRKGSGAYDCADVIFYVTGSYYFYRVYDTLRRRYMKKKQNIVPLKDLNLTDRFLFDEVIVYWHVHNQTN